MKKIAGYLIAMLAAALVTAGILSLLLNIRERKEEARTTHVSVVELTEKDTDPKKWGQNFPREYDSYRRTSDTKRTRYGGSEAISKIDDKFALWKRFFNGYAFGVEYREERGHAYSLDDQKETLRTKQFQQPGACLHCHAGGMKNIYETVGQGNLMKGFAEVNKMPLQEAWQHADHPIACVDCHDPATMRLRVTRPGFLEGIKRVKEKEGIRDYDPNTMASPQEMRTMVCAQCHVEYYFKGPDKYLTYPWHNGLKAEQIEAYYDEVGHKDWTHAETGAPVLKAQHPEFEMWNQGIHARSGVACADCHMPYKREGATKVTDHHVRSPLLNIESACLQCHHFSAEEMKSRAEAIQDRTRLMMDRAEQALIHLIDAIVKAKAAGIPEADLADAQDFHRKGQWRLDFVSAENSMGFHAPQEVARLLAESIDYSRQGELAVQKILLGTEQRQKIDAYLAAEAPPAATGETKK